MCNCCYTIFIIMHNALVHILWVIFSSLLCICWGNSCIYIHVWICMYVKKVSFLIFFIFISVLYLYIYACLIINRSVGHDNLCRALAKRYSSLFKRDIQGSSEIAIGVGGGLLIAFSYNKSYYFSIYIYICIIYMYIWCIIMYKCSTFIFIYIYTSFIIHKYNVIYT